MSNISDIKENRFELREPIRSFLTSIKKTSGSDACALYLTSDLMDVDEKKEEFLKRFPAGIANGIETDHIDKYHVLKFIGVDDKDENPGICHWKFDYKNRPDKYIILDSDKKEAIPGEGITGMAARLKDILYFDSEKDIKTCPARSTVKFDTQRGIHPSCIKLLTIPITRPDRPYSIGVIRLDIYSEEKNFSDDYLKMKEEKLNSRLFSFINSMCMVFVDISNRDAESKSYKALYKGEKMLERVKRISINDDQKMNSDVYGLVRHLFFVFQRNTYIGHEEIMKRVFYFINDLCFATGLPYFNIIENNLEAFRDHENLLLYDIEQYRDHFMHQFHIFVLGYVIMNHVGIEKITEIVNKRLKLTTGYEKQTLKPDNILRIWVLISFFHDITYIMQKFKKGIHDFLKKQMKVDFSIYINWSELFSEDLNYAPNLIKMSHMFQSASDGAMTNTQDLLSRCFQSIEFKQDHGVISALLLMEQLLPFIHNQKKQYTSDTARNEANNTAVLEVYLAALTISMHNPYIFKGLKEGKSCMLSFESFPLEFLLVYCDTVQEWGRRKKKIDGGSYYDDPTLTCLTLKGEAICCALEYPTGNAPSESTLKDIVQERTGSFCSHEFKFSLKYKLATIADPLEFDFPRC